MMTKMINRTIFKILKLCGFGAALLLAWTRLAMADATGLLSCPYIYPKQIILAMSRPTCGMSDGAFDPNSNCFWFSKGLRQIFEAMDKIGSAVYDSLAGTNGKPEFAIPILAVCFGIWLAWQVMRYVGPLHAQAPGDFFEILAHGFFRLLVACCLIKWGASAAFDYFIGMFAVTAANVGTEIMVKAGQVLDVGGVSEFTINYGGTTPTAVMELHAAVALNLKMAATLFMEIVGMGYVLIQFAYNDGILCLLPSIDPLWTGYVLITAALILVFIIPFKFLDILFRLTLVYALLPMLIVAWVFPSTRKYSMKAWGIVMNAVCLLLIMSVLFALCTGMISNLVLSGSTSSGALDDPKILYNLFRTDENCEDKNMLLIMLVALFLAIKSLNLGKDLAGHLSETPSGSVAEGTLNAMAGKVGGSAAAAAMAGAGLAGGAVLDKMADGMKSLGNRAGNAAGRVAGSLAGAQGGGMSPRFTTHHNVDAAAAGGGVIASSDMGSSSGGKGGRGQSEFGGSNAGGGSGGGNAANQLGDIQAKLAGVEKQNADLEKEIMEKLSFVNKDILANMDYEQKKGLKDMAHALDMAKKSPENKSKVTVAEKVLRYAVVNNLNNSGDAAKFAQLCNGMKDRLDNGSGLSMGEIYKGVYGDNATSAMMRDLKQETLEGKKLNPTQLKIVERQMQMDGKSAELAQQYIKDCEARNNGGNLANTAERMAVLDYLTGAGRNTEAGIAFNNELNKMQAGGGQAAASGNPVQETVAEAVASGGNSSKAQAKYDAEEAQYRTEAEDERKEAVLRQKLEILKARKSELKHQISEHKNVSDDLDKEIENLENERKAAEKAIGDGDTGSGINTDMAALDENGKPIKNTGDV